jgi:hypothetical protein
MPALISGSQYGPSRRMKGGPFNREGISMSYGYTCLGCCENRYRGCGGRLLGRTQREAAGWLQVRANLEPRSVSSGSRWRGRVLRGEFRWMSSSMAMANDATWFKFKLCKMVESLTVFVCLKCNHELPVASQSLSITHIQIKLNLQWFYDTKD